MLCLKFVEGSYTVSGCADFACSMTNPVNGWDHLLLQ